MGADRQIWVGLCRHPIGKSRVDLSEPPSATWNDEAHGCDHQQQDAARDGVAGESPRGDLGRNALVHAAPRHEDHHEARRHQDSTDEAHCLEQVIHMLTLALRRGPPPDRQLGAHLLLDQFGGPPSGLTRRWSA
jgi:hypothetical protein